MTEDELIATKKNLRQKLLAARRVLTTEQRLNASQIITRRFLASEEYQQSPTLLLYASMPDEVQLYELMKRALADGKTVALPLVTGTGQMEAVALNSMDDLVPDKYGIKTVAPTKRVTISPSQIATIIVPGVGFDMNGRRLGLGGGFYDRYLLRASNAKHIAFCYACQLLKTIPVAAHDMSVEKIITEQAIVTIK